jgi:predicted RNA-binding Zn-ribbon protein involved in translation (DUF1610 family)
MIQFLCLHCNHKIYMPDNQTDEKVNCPKCNKVNIVPKPIFENNKTNQEGLNIMETHDEHVLEENDASDNIINEKENPIEQYAMKDECDSFPETPKNNKNDTSTELQQYEIADPTKSCPSCGKIINESAKHCTHCGENFDAPIPTPSPQAHINISRHQPSYVKTSRMAIAALVLSLSGLGIIFGFVALRKIRKSNGCLSGRRLAFAAIVISVICVVFSIIFWDSLISLIGNIFS